MTKHHLVNKCRGGHATPDNLLQLWNDKHEIWHVLFKNDSPEEIIKVLERMIRMKGRTWATTSLSANHSISPSALSVEGKSPATWVNTSASRTTLKRMNGERFALQMTPATTKPSSDTNG